MIARRWHGMVPADKADEYRQLMLDVAIPDYKAAVGNLGALCFERAEAALVHFEMLSFWDGLASLEAFAGASVEQARYYPFDADFLIEMEQSVLHFTVSGQ